LHKNWLLQQVIEGKIKEGIEVKGGRRHRKLALRKGEDTLI
jgi:hypothetical protein